MKKAYLALSCLLLIGRSLAHPCPFAWNIEFEEETTVTGENLDEFVTNFNKAMELESGGEYKDVASFSIKPDSLLIVPEDCSLRTEKAELIERYSQTSKLLRRRELSVMEAVQSRQLFLVTFR